MKKILSLIAIGLALSLGSAHAADDGKTKQQTKMTECNKQAEGKKGDDRKAFMKQCLSAKPAVEEKKEAKKETQQEKMKSCNASAKDKKGDDRKAFMKECLSKSA